MSNLGTRVVRTEDPRLLTAGGSYTDDLRLPELDGAVRATVVRSPVAHARITGIDTGAALASPGVVAVLTAADLDDIPPGSDEPTAEPLLATDRVRYVGESVALVLTEHGSQGEDAAELVSVDYEPLPAVVSLDDSLAGRTLLFPGADTNVVNSGGDPAPADAFSGCDVVIERTFPNQRVAPVPLEVRAAAARWADGRLTVWASTQNAQLARDAIAEAVGLEPGAVRVIAPDVGGGFGAKIAVERDTLVIAWAARRVGRPVRWVETRNENLLCMVHGRAQRHTITIGGTRDGRILAYHLDIVQDCGAYPRFGPFLPTLTKLMASGVYDLPYCGATFQAVVTNTTPIAAYRGGGTAGGHRRDRAGRGPVRHRDRDGPGRGPAAERGAVRRLPVHHRERGFLRHRGVRGRAGQGAGRGGIRRAAGRAGPAPRARWPGPARHRPGQLRGDHRGRLQRR
jgi:aerobic carbon-monoxide dehydrogenase large subunit